MKHGTRAAAALHEVAGVPMFDLRVAPGTSAHAAVSEALDLTLPAKTGVVSGGVGAHALCLAPDWWLIVGSPEADKNLSPLRAQGYHFSVVDVSGQRTTIDLEGPNAQEVLAHLWEQDLREKTFPVGHVSQGLMVKAPVIVWHFAPSHYRILVRSSFALHLWKALTDAAVEYV